MPEMLNTYTKDGIKIGKVDKKEYYKNRDTKTQPWIKCVTCFVIDDANKKILFEKRGKTQIDAGKLDLCSGHVSGDELPIQTMVRELQEELGITEDDSRNLKYLGKVDMDYYLLSNKGENFPNLKCLGTVYALKMHDISKIKIDNYEVVREGWLDYEDAIGFVKNNMTRFAYTEETAEKFDEVFSTLKEYMYPEKGSQRKEKII